jgi:hypothetical protein
MNNENNSWRLFPYIPIDGIPTMTDSFIMGLYEKMAIEGLAHRVFIEGIVKNKEDFLYVMKFKKTRLFVLKKEENIGGIIWLNNFGVKTAEFHICLFSAIYGREFIKVGKKAVCMLLEMKCGENYLFDMLFGVVPESNTLARSWARRMGFKILGMMPNALFDANHGYSIPGEYFYVERGQYHE